MTRQSIAVVGLLKGDSVLISDYNDEWKELRSGGFLPTSVLVEIRE